MSHPHAVRAPSGTARGGASTGQRQSVLTSAAGFVREVPAAGWWIVALAVSRALVLSAAVLLAAQSVDRLLGGDPPGATVWFAALAVVVAATVAAAEAYLPGRAQSSQERVQRRRVMRGLLSLDLDTLVPLGERTTLATEDVERSAAARAGFMGPLIAAFLVPLAVLVVIGAAVSPLVAGVALFGVIAIPPVISWFMTRFRAGTGRFRMISARLAAHFLETMRAIDTIRLLGAGSDRRAVLAERSSDVRREAMALLRRNQVVLLVTDGIFGLVMVVLVSILGLWQLQSGAITAGEAVALVVFSVLLREPLDALGRSFYVGLAGRAAGERVAQASRASDSAAQGASSVPARDYGRLRDGLLVAGLTIERRGRTVLRDVSAAFPSGLTTIVGRSGAGKSTLARALAGLTESGGAVHDAGGQPLPVSTLIRDVAYIPQSTVLIEGTVRENLLLAAPAAADAELEYAIERAGLTEVSYALAHGLDTVIGSASRGVSGGQAQRIAIARALLTDRAVVVADEPTANLDAEAAALVTDTFRALARDRTVIVVTHRLDAIGSDDRVVIVHDGRVVGVGTRAALADDFRRIEDAPAASNDRAVDTARHGERSR